MTGGDRQLLRNEWNVPSKKQRTQPEQHRQQHDGYDESHKSLPQTDQTDITNTHQPSLTVAL